jgi:hypothetical protein
MTTLEFMEVEEFGSESTSRVFRKLGKLEVIVQTKEGLEFANEEEGLEWREDEDISDVLSSIFKKPIHRLNSELLQSAYTVDYLEDSSMEWEELDELHQLERTNKIRIRFVDETQSSLDEMQQDCVWKLDPALVKQTEWVVANGNGSSFGCLILKDGPQVKLPVEFGQVEELFFKQCCLADGRSQYGLERVTVLNLPALERKFQTQVTRMKSNIGRSPSFTRKKWTHKPDKKLRQAYMDSLAG